MKVTQKELKEQEVIQDVTCDSCGKSCKTDYGFEYLNMEANWGFMSNNKDLQKWEAQVCEECVDNLLGFINFRKNYYINA